MLDKYWMDESFIGYSNIGGVEYIALKNNRYAEYKYHIIKAGEDNNWIYQCDTKAQIEKYFSKLRIEFKDATIRAKRDALNAKGINVTSEHVASMETITSAYEDYKKSLEY